MTSELEALKKIRELARPRQTLDLRTAVDLICDVWNTADQAILAHHRAAKHAHDGRTADGRNAR